MNTWNSILQWIDAGNGDVLFWGIVILFSIECLLKRFGYVSRFKIGKEK